jgi:hypothetical protein
MMGTNEAELLCAGNRGEGRESPTGLGAVNDSVLKTCIVCPFSFAISVQDADDRNTADEI